MRRVDSVKRDTLDYTEFYWWNLQKRLEGQDEAMIKKDQADRKQEK